MAAKDLYDDNVRTALIKDGWTITDDPFSLKIGERDLFVDLGAEKLLIADRGQEKIAIEVKSFISPSPVKDLENALGQYILYANIMAREYPDRTLYLAIRDEIYYSFFLEEIAQLVLETQRLKLLVFDAIEEVIVQWLN
jgi:hypothetical protein